MPHALEIIGNLAVEMGGDGSARVEARGDSIVVELPSLRAGLAALKRWPGGRGGRAASIRRVHDGLVAAGLTLDVRVGPKRFARLGVGARPNLASRVLGLGPMEVGLVGLISRKRPGGPPEP